MSKHRKTKKEKLAGKKYVFLQKENNETNEIIPEKTTSENKIADQDTNFTGDIKSFIFISILLLCIFAAIYFALKLDFIKNLTTLL